MPASLIAAAVLLTLFVPGYLFQYGVREFTSVAAAERDVYAVAQAVAISAGLIISVFLPLTLLEAFGVEAAETLQRGLLNDPSGPTEGLTVAQAVALPLLLAISNPLGKGFGLIMRRRRATRLQEPGERSRGRKALSCLNPLNFFFSTAPIDKRFDDIIKAVETGTPTYVRLVRQGAEDVIGLVDKDAAKASKSALGQGLALTARWIRTEDGWQRLSGAHVGKSGLVKILDWTATQAPPRPAWLEGVGPLHGEVDRLQKAPPRRLFRRCSAERGWRKPG